MKAKKRSFWRSLGPGLVTGAADDDPAGIATYSQAGALAGTRMLWTLPWSLPLMAGVQLLSARLALATRRGIAANLRLHYPRWLLIPTVTLLVAANLVNLAADVIAMGAAGSLLLGGPILLYAVPLSLASLLLVVFVPYHSYAVYLKLLTLVLLAYVAVLFTLDIPWSQVALHSFLPQLTWDPTMLGIIVAILGTTISPYLFFWQSAEEVEEHRGRPRRGFLRKWRIARADTILGMTVSNLVAMCVVLSVALTLHAQGTTDIATAEEAAKALEPVAGRHAVILFAVGLIGTALLAIPVLAGSAAYAVAEAMRWRSGMEAPARKVPAFNAIIAGLVLAALALTVMRIDVVDALVLSAIINGVVAPPLIALLTHMARNGKVMGKQSASRPLAATGYLTAATMALAAIAYLASSVIK